jgi:hypothetical protein
VGNPARIRLGYSPEIEKDSLIVLDWLFRAQAGQTINEDRQAVFHSIHNPQ